MDSLLAERIPRLLYVLRPFRLPEHGSLLFSPVLLTGSSPALSLVPIIFFMFSLFVGTSPIILLPNLWRSPDYLFSVVAAGGGRVCLCVWRHWHLSHACAAQIYISRSWLQKCKTFLTKQTPATSPPTNLSPCLPTSPKQLPYFEDWEL